jgi:hypothetical protein
MLEHVPPADRAPESVRTLFSAHSCPGCGDAFLPARKDQRHCRPSCRKRAVRRRQEDRRTVLLADLWSSDPGWPE